MKVGIIGLGYVGLPLTVAVTRSISAENLVRR
jgi:UDP-N-acetyl-D-mannosaminuronate dehydrogenase